MYITRNTRASQFLGDETATMGTRKDTPVQTMRNPLFALTAERERDGGREKGRRREQYIDVDEGKREEERGKMPGVRPITQADGANQGAMRLP